MPKRTDIRSVMIIGAGPIVIGQACEFDYSGAQACKALREEGFRVILVNSNPATIMTDPDLADATYIEPITPEIVARIIRLERPDALLPTMGGQTGLNTALAVEEMGVLAECGVEMIGARREAIEMAEDRALFREAMTRIGLENPRAAIVEAPKLANGKRDYAAGMAEAARIVEEVGLPAIIRPAYTLGGTGGGIANNREEYLALVRSGMEASPAGQVLVDESLLGWKEFEMEVVRDRADNAIIVCAIENVDPMGVHTGDSITVAPTLTLTDKEYQRMRSASIAVLREIGVETGGSNVQWAVDPATGRMVVIEMNPRVSRSSALASKATGFPIAKIAAKLAVGYTLDELDNDITGVTPASFEPSIDYVVTKIPRFAFEKFPGAEPVLTTAMKSVGEAMAVGRSFHESLQKALASLETGLTGLDEIPIDGVQEPLAAAAGPDAQMARVAENARALTAALAQRHPDRILRIAQAMRMGLADADIARVTAFDPWFLARIREIVDIEEDVRAAGLPRDADALRRLKLHGFTDARLAALAGRTEDEVRRLRRRLDVHPVFKRIDTCAAEFEAQTPYMYSAYEAPIMGEAECEARPSSRRKVVILGGGPNRIGQGIEFDYCCVHACYALSAAGFETIMVNCNPETVSTDYDTSDRLYFEPLTLEHVLEILEVERRAGTLAGVLVQYGGQTPLKLARALEAEGYPLLGTPADVIDRAEDRERFGALVTELGLRQPPGAMARSAQEAREAARRIGYPLVIRPSYVLGGRAMEIVRSDADLDHYLATAVRASAGQPVLLDSYLSGATEVDVDAVCDGVETRIAGIMQHIEEAGVHSGDSACVLPPHTLPRAVQEEMAAQTHRLAMALGVRGLMNVQFAVREAPPAPPARTPPAGTAPPSSARAAPAAPAPLRSEPAEDPPARHSLHPGATSVAVTLPSPPGEGPGVGADRNDPVGADRKDPAGTDRKDPAGTDRKDPVGADPSNAPGTPPGGSPGPAAPAHEVHLIEVNPRASRTVPFVAKATGVPVAAIAARVMAGERLADLWPADAPSPFSDPDPDAASDLDAAPGPAADPAPASPAGTLPSPSGEGPGVGPEAGAPPTDPAGAPPRGFAVKEAVLPFARFPGVDTLLGPEMRSTGEVMGAAPDFPTAFLKAQMGAGVVLPTEGRAFLSVRDADKGPALLRTARILRALGLAVLATRGTAAFLAAEGIEAETVNKVYEGGRTIADRLADGEVALVMNTTEGAQAIDDSRSIRRAALTARIPYFTTLAGSLAGAQAMEAMGRGEVGVRALQA